jgi:hypothetical protein
MSALLLALSGFAWPALILAIGIYYRKEIDAVIG